MTLTHSSCKDFSIAGILVAEGGRGLTRGDAENRLKFMKNLNGFHLYNKTTCFRFYHLHWARTFFIPSRSTTICTITVHWFPQKKTVSPKRVLVETEFLTLLSIILMQRKLLILAAARCNRTHCNRTKCTLHFFFLFLLFSGGKF